MTAATSSGLPPASVANGRLVYAESRLLGTTVHVDPWCRYARLGTFPLRNQCTAVQALVWLAPSWCLYCTGRPR